MANIAVIRYRRIFWVLAVFMSIYMLTVTLEAKKQRTRFTKDSLSDLTQNEFRKERMRSDDILNIEMKQHGEMEAVHEQHEQQEVNKNAALVFELAQPVNLPAGDTNKEPVHAMESVISPNEQIKMDISGVRTNGCDAFLKHAAHPPTLVPLSTQANTPKIFHFIHYNEHLSNPRYLCSLESAARINPNYQINVYARNSSHFKISISKWLSLLDTTISSRIFIHELVWKDAMMGTPLEQWYTLEKWKESSWVDQNLGNAFRLGILYHYGGVYLDLDIVSLNPVEAMMQDRTVAMQDGKWYNNAVFRFPPGDAFVKAMMEEFVSGFEGFVWARNGPRMVTRTMAKHCKKAPLADMCQSLLVLPANKFFPIQYEQREQLFAAFEDSCELMQKLSDGSVGIHWWSKRVQSTIISTRTVLTMLMIVQCPVVFTSFSEEQLGVSQTAKLGVPASSVNKLNTHTQQHTMAIKMPHLIMALTTLLVLAYITIGYLAGDNPTKSPISVTVASTIKTGPEPPKLQPVNNPAPPPKAGFAHVYPESGVDVEVVKEGDGVTFPKKGDTVTIHYTGKLKDGTKFDSSVDRGSPFVTVIGVGKVIRGWDEGVPQLSKGAKGILRISADYAYGTRGSQPVIPPNSELMFEVELIDVKSSSA
ncbi:hypothetical protein HDU80_004906 [Chytriomyces hyalinus]|nr:hypothetical protein HDU80_004906 [Chytriomyces hyalinus]